MKTCKYAVMVGMILVFSFVTAYSQNITSPKAGDKWIGGSTQTIAWKGGTGLAKLWLVKRGADAQKIGETVVTNPLGTGFDWKVSGAPGSGYLIKIEFFRLDCEDKPEGNPLAWGKCYQFLSGQFSIAIDPSLKPLADGALKQVPEGGGKQKRK